MANSQQVTNNVPTVKIKYYNVKINRQIFLDQAVRNNLRTYNSIEKFGIGLVDDCTICCFLDYSYSKYYLKVIAIDLSKQKVFDALPKAIEQINFTGNVAAGAAGATKLLIIKEAKKTILHFSEGALRVV